MCYNQATSVFRYICMSCDYFKEHYRKEEKRKVLFCIGSFLPIVGWFPGELSKEKSFDFAWVPMAAGEPNERGR